MLRHLKNIIMKMISFTMPFAVLLWLYNITSWGKCLILLCMKCEMKPKLLLKKRGTKYKEIYFNFVYQYNSFNMCLVSEILGGGMIASILGGKAIFVDKYIEEPFEKRNVCMFEEIYEQKKLGMQTTSIDNICYSPSVEAVIDKRRRASWCIIYKRNCVLNDATKEYIKRTKARLNWNENDRILGINIRGTDYIKLQPKGHPIQPTIDELTSACEMAITSEKYDKIYITSDELSAIHIFKARFGDRVIYMDRKYYDSYNMNSDITHVTQVHFHRDDDRYLKGLEYFTSVELLAECTGIVSGMSGATKIALIMNDLNYEYEDLIFKGYY